MKQTAVCILGVLMLTISAKGQNPEVKLVADTLVVEAEGSFEADPDLATLTFDVSSQDKQLKPAYDRASQAIQNIVALAVKNGLKSEDILSGVLTVRPYYEGDRKKRAKSFLVQGQVVLKVRDFSKLASLMEGSATDEITDFRSLTDSLADEEGAKQRAVAEAMRRAIGRATAALQQKDQKVGALRFASLDVRQLVGVAQLEVGSVSQTIDALDGSRRAAKAALPPPPLPRPEKISVSAIVQCGFQIQ
jgi:uncharacterized protein